MARRNNRATDVQVWAKRSRRLRQWGTESLPLTASLSFTELSSANPTPPGEVGLSPGQTVQESELSA